jgi:hypothetical protein
MRTKHDSSNMDHKEINMTLLPAGFDRYTEVNIWHVNREVIISVTQNTINFPPHCNKSNVKPVISGHDRKPKVCGVDLR